MENGEEGVRRNDAPSRVNALTTYSVSSAKKGMRAISNGEEIKGIPFSRLVPRKSVNPPDKTSSPIDRQEGSMVGCEIIFKLSFIEPVSKGRITLLITKFPIEITRETTDVISSVQAGKNTK